MKLVDVKSNTSYIDFNKENNNEGPILEVGNNVKMSKYKISFCKGLHSKFVRKSFCD